MEGNTLCAFLIYKLFINRSTLACRENHLIIEAYDEYRTHLMQQAVIQRLHSRSYIGYTLNEY